ncbi:unnamed protein product [Gulo gulo]|uniref:Uncharacterized protein n=1 Tax=Gulo gulo TaxID=48420 RepID=A0A9X9M3N2_GULGU|nr:unnamed protein product [Gulo gulo]
MLGNPRRRLRSLLWTSGWPCPQMLAESRRLTAEMAQFSTSHNVVLLVLPSRDDYLLNLGGCQGREKPDDWRRDTYMRGRTVRKMGSRMCEFHLAAFWSLSQLYKMAEILTSHQFLPGFLASGRHLLIGKYLKRRQNIGLMMLYFSSP